MTLSSAKLGFHHQLFFFPEATSVSITQASSKEVFPSTTSSAPASEAARFEHQFLRRYLNRSNAFEYRFLMSFDWKKALGQTQQVGSQMEKLENKLDKLTKTLSNTVRGQGFRVTATVCLSKT